ncbi:bifunctional phosphoserine phosphatase/homoserine phosphotransferase ThrH [Pseudomonadota bacterium]|nr:bifunctional phosphoserine phosphatase/homoserine phosphotransferase ThrH [Pseudomonadota bacterium]
MKIACLDFEGVLVPEIWVNLAKKTGIEELKLTTRDIPDYDELMGHRLNTLNKAGIEFKELEEAAKQLVPLEGALDFLTWLREHFQVAIVSDTFYELCKPLVKQLNQPMMLCHRLSIKDRRLEGYNLRQENGKHFVVKGFQSMNFTVIATGDSYNDIGMLKQADKSILFNPPKKVIEDYPEFEIAKNYSELTSFFEKEAK